MNDLAYIVSPRKDDDGNPYEIHFLVDRLSNRAYGYVEAPCGKYDILFRASPYDGKDRMYLTLDAAKGHIEHMALQEDATECSNLAESLVDKEEKVKQENI